VLYVSTFCAAPWLLREGRHIRMEMLLKSVPPRVGWALELAADALGMLTCFVLCIAGVNVAWTSTRDEALVFKVFIIPEWWVLTPAAVLLFVLGVEFVFRLKRLWLGPRRPRDEATSAA